MAYSNDAVYPQGGKNFAAKATAAKTTMSDTTNAVLLYTAPAGQMARVKRCNAWPQATNTATVCYLFTKASGSSTLFMKAAKQAAAQSTISTTVAQTEIDMGPSEDEPMILSPGEELYCAISVANASGFVFEGQVEEF